jgi:hypothetical protein
LIPAELGIVPPAASVDALVNVSDGAADRIYVDSGVDLTPKR